MLIFCFIVFFFFKQKTAYEMRISDWSSDVCSSDLDWARRHHLPALAGDARAEIAVIVDADADRRAQAGAQFSAPTASSLDEALTGAQLDGVVVATPHSTHASLVTAALNAGLAVLVEKPLTLTSAEAIEIVGRRSDD